MTLSIRKFKGINNVLPTYNHVDVQFVGRTAIAEAFLTDAINLDITDNYKLVMRDGFVEKYAHDGIHSLWSDGKTCLFREGINLNKLTSDFEVIPLRTDLTNRPVPMSYLTLIGKIFYSDKIDSGVIENGVSRSWGLDVPPKPNLTQINGLLPEGTYQVSLVYIRNDGQMSGASNPVSLTIEKNKGIFVSGIKASEDDSVSYIDIYASSVNGEALYKYGRISNINSTYSILNKTLSSGLSLSTIGMNKPPVGNIIDYYNGRIYVVDGNVVWYSEPFAYELFKAKNNYLMFESQINVFAAVRDGIWVATDKNIYFLSGDNPPFMFTEKEKYGGKFGTAQKIPSSSISDRKGILYLKEYQDYAIMFATEKGICIGYNDGTLRNLTEENIIFPASSSGVSLFRSDKGFNQYIVSLYN
jgi:hypothetical protein